MSWYLSETRNSGKIFLYCYHFDDSQMKIGHHSFSPLLGNRKAIHEGRKNALACYHVGRKKNHYWGKLFD